MHVLYENDLSHKTKDKYLKNKNFNGTGPKSFM